MAYHTVSVVIPDVETQAYSAVSIRKRYLAHELWHGRFGRG